MPDRQVKTIRDSSAVGVIYPPQLARRRRGGFDLLSIRQDNCA
jgi:hypothetical protein